MLKENTVTKKPKSKGNSYFFMDTSNFGSTNDIVEILDPTNFDIPEHFRRTR